MPQASRQGQQAPAPARDAQSSAGDENITRVQAPATALLKRGEAIRGIGEKLAANPVTGIGPISVPIGAFPGHSGFGPLLALSYDSGSDSVPFGFGWSLTIPTITRKTHEPAAVH